MSSTGHLNREKIAAAALAIADAEGFACVSMRRLAQELRVGTMSLYYYVGTKAELIAAMDDALTAAQGSDYDCAPCTRCVHTASMGACLHTIRAPPGVNAMRHMEQSLQVLSGTGMSAQEKAHAAGGHR